MTKLKRIASLVLELAGALLVVSGLWFLSSSLETTQRILIIIFSLFTNIAITRFVFSKLNKASHEQIIQRKIASAFLISTILLWIFMLYSGGFDHDVKQPSPVTRSLNAEKPWGNSEEIICMGGVEYLYVHKTFMGGLTPNYVSGSIRSCNEKSFPKRLKDYEYSLYEVCRDGTMHYQLSNPKGTAISVALKQDGLPRTCYNESATANESL